MQILLMYVSILNYFFDQFSLCECDVNQRTSTTIKTTGSYWCIQLSMIVSFANDNSSPRNRWCSGTKMLRPLMGRNGWYFSDNLTRMVCRFSMKPDYLVRTITLKTRGGGRQTTKVWLRIDFFTLTTYFWPVESKSVVKIILSHQEVMFFSLATSITTP